MNEKVKYQSLWMVLCQFIFCSFLLVILRQMQPENDLFSQINSLTVFFAVTGSAIIYFLGYRRFSDICLLLLAVSLFFTIFQTALLNVDRSRSFYIIGWVHSQKVQFRADIPDFSKVNSSEKLNPYAMEQRLNEQIDRGHIVKKDNNLTLSVSGSSLFYTAEILAKIFKLNHWLENKH